MRMRTFSAATVAAAALIFALGGPAAFAADQMSNGKDTETGAMAPHKDTAMSHSGGSMAHQESGAMSGMSHTTGKTGDTTMSHDKMNH
jgi:hypothetical protein